MIPGESYGKEATKRAFTSRTGHSGRPNGEDLIATVETRKGISILLRVLGRSRSEVAPHARMRLENS